MPTPLGLPIVDTRLGNDPSDSYTYSGVGLPTEDQVREMRKRRGRQGSEHSGVAGVVPIGIGAGMMIVGYLLFRRGRMG